MKGFLPLVIISATLSSALPSQKRSTPCPYQKGGTAREPLLKDEYTVELNPNYTLEEHYDFIGFNLSTKAEKFHSMKALNMYRIKTDKDTMHNIIRYDPGVLQVTHNMVLSPNKAWYKSYESVNETDTDDRLQKRWSRYGGVYHYYVGHVNEWNRAWNYFDELYHTTWIYPAGKAADIYVLDEGFDGAHEIWRRLGNFRYLRDGKKYTDEEVWENAEHGTAVGGVAGRIAPFARIVGAKVLGAGGSYYLMEQAINDIVEDHKKYREESPDEYRGAVINMSFWVDERDTLKAAIQKAISAGIPVVTSAGNGDRFQNGLPEGSRPCGYENVICVGAIAKDFRKTQYSNYGKYVTLYAPGHHIHVPKPGRHDYHYMDGTSFASPMVAGILAEFISYEGINDNATKVIERLKQNWHEGVLDSATPNILVNSGLDHPDKIDVCPYNGVEVCNDEAPPEEIDSGYGEDPPDEPSKFMDEPHLAPPEPATCPFGCTCGSSGVPLCP